MKLLFISRSYPPLIGGLEKHNHAINRTLSKKISVSALVNTRGKRVLPWFFCLCFMRVLLVLFRRESVLLGDGVLSIIGWFIKCIKPSVSVVCIIHGLDITYKNRFYQFFWVKCFLPKVDKIIAVSQATADEAVSRGISRTRLVVIPNGVYPLSPPLLAPVPRTQGFLATELNISSDGKVILLTVGRLVKRKGIAWFINHVFTQLPSSVIYIVAGDGPEKQLIQQAIIEQQLSQQVYCLGSVSESIKTQLFESADLFIQPNIKVEGDMEGFGIAVLEANVHGLSVLGARLEGLKDSITDGENGWLLESEDASQFINKIVQVTASKPELKLAGQKAKAFCLQKFCWDKIADQYISVFEELVVHKNEC